MTTPQNRQLTKGGGGDNSTKENYTGHRLGTNDGEIRFGQIDKEGTVTSGVYLNAKEGTHVITLDNDGPRKGYTTSISPSNFQLACGRDCTKEEDSMILFADNGNIIINAGNGNIRFIANSMEFTCQGEDGKEGNFIVNASQTITLDSKKIQASAKNFLKKVAKLSVAKKKRVAKKKEPQISSYKPKKNEKYMSAAMKRHFNKVLLNWREHLKEEMQKTFDHLKNKGETFADPVDRASQEEEFAFELRTRDRERKLIKKIVSSLEQIKQDDYGYCYSCGIEIGLKRLEARPTATHCIDCKTLDEIKEKQLGG